MKPPRFARRMPFRAVRLGLALLAGLTLLSACHWDWTAPMRHTPLPPTRTPEPLVPTVPPAFRATAVSRTAPAATASSALPPLAPAGGATGSRFPFGGPSAGRAGVAFPLRGITDFDWGDGPPGWWLIWRVEPRPPRLGDSRFVQMVRINGDAHRPDLPAIVAAARAEPGSLWLIGNEPDVAWQDNATPAQYASTYGLLHDAIKAADPTALIAIAGVSQPTPMRLAYLDAVLAAHRSQYGTEMPVDVWNVHAFILREERDSWGVGIPPGTEADRGQLYEIADHADMAIFKQQIIDFRRWMAERGLQDKPLIVTEYGILMPEAYGFPPDLVAGFLAETFDFFLTARDAEIGRPDDDHRLVQAFCWYSAADTVYPSSNLFDPDTGAATPAGEVFVAYMAGLRRSPAP